MAEHSGDSHGEGSAEFATFGGGCFWCTEAVFSEVRGVNGVVSGYAGGDVPNPSYELVCSGTTGHAEVVQVRFDPGAVSYRQLLEIFFMTHDPTTRDRQGADYGRQYRSIILYQGEEQRRIAEETIKWVDEQELYTDPVLTEVSPLKEFYPAESYHQGYFRKNPGKPYCRIVINPKLGKFRHRFAELLSA